MALDAFGFVVGIGSFSLSKQTMLVTDDSITAFNADVLSLSLTGVNLFVGVGGALNVAKDDIVTTDAIGFEATGDLSLALVNNTDTLGNNYTGLEISNLSASLIGITDLTFDISAAKVQVSQATVGDRLDWAAATVTDHTLISEKVLARASSRAF